MAGVGGVSDLTVVQRMEGAVHTAVYGPSGYYWRLPPEDQRKLGYFDDADVWHEVCPIDVVEYPPRSDVEALAQEGVHLSPNDRLLGLFTARGDGSDPHISVYALPILEVHADPGEVALHEIGHLVDPVGHPDFPAYEAVALPEPEPGQIGRDCPFCNVDEELSVVAMALDALRQRAHLMHKVPPGLGGRVPESRRRLVRARHELDRAAKLMPERAGQARTVADAIERTQASLEGQLGPDALSRAWQLAYAAHDLNTDFAHAYYLKALYGPAG
jgi:hypothetical protein